MGNLIVNAIYNHSGRVMIAISGEHLVPVMDTDGMQYAANEATFLVAHPGDDDWIEKMLDIRTRLVNDLRFERAELSRRDTYLEGLRQAILEKAIEKDWCEEYDEFAEEWDLPKREREYMVTMTVSVLARDREEAEEMVAEKISIRDYDEGVLRGPEITAEGGY